MLAAVVMHELLDRTTRPYLGAAAAWGYRLGGDEDKGEASSAFFLMIWFFPSPMLSEVLCCDIKWLPS
jgi:hypothetical protein